MEVKAIGGQGHWRSRPLEVKAIGGQGQLRSTLAEVKVIRAPGKHPARGAVVIFSFPFTSLGKHAVAGTETSILPYDILILGTWHLVSSRWRVRTLFKNGGGRSSHSLPPLLKQEGRGFRRLGECLHVAFRCFRLALACMLPCAVLGFGDPGLVGSRASVLSYRVQPRSKRNVLGGMFQYPRIFCDRYFLASQ